MRRLEALALILAAALTSSQARANDAECVAAFESTQRLRKEGKLRAARDQALVCSASSCPAIVVQDCAPWVTEIEAVTPSVVFAATSGERELVDVEVLVDGVSLVARLDGRARALDPGPHRVRFVSPGYEPAELDVVVAEGEKNRKLSANLSPTVTHRDAPARAKSETSPSRPVPALTLILGGVSAVSFVGAAVFGVDGLGRKSALDGLGCKPACDDAAISATERSFIVADVLAAVGIVAAVAAAVTYATRAPSQPPTVSRLGMW